MDTAPIAKHEHRTLKFPDRFLWGAGNSAFQCEGNVRDSDWWEWERKFQSPSKWSKDASDHYNRYEEDFDLAKRLGHNAHRLSLEWSRIEPAEGMFNLVAIEHYQKVLQALKERGIKVMLSLHHFSNPLWFARLGGWTNPKSVDFFERFVRRVVPDIKDQVDFWITINEPSVYVNFAYYSGDFPPGKQNHNWWKMIWAYLHMAQAHKRAYRTIHEIIPHAKVGLANAVQSFNVLHNHSVREHLGAWGLDIGGNHLIYLFTGKNTHDFLGVNYYTNQYVSFNGKAHIPGFLDITQTDKEVSDMGWEIYPQGIFEVLMDFSDYHKPIYITENGIASTNDDRRVRFLINYLQEVFHATRAGADVRGYFYWSLLDNMELHRGFDPRFGLIEVDFKTQKRTIRPSAFVYKDIIKNNGIPHYLLRLLGHSMNVEDVFASNEINIAELHEHLMADKNS